VEIIEMVEKIPSLVILIGVLIAIFLPSTILKLERKTEYKVRSVMGALLIIVCLIFMFK